jgi:L-lactate dehydrogenase (cytochrome)/(S)-mandelate dehydrogenase
VQGTLSSWTVEEVVAAVDQPPFFQLYPMGDRDMVASLMKRAWDVGCRLLMLTVDVPVRGNREGERRGGCRCSPPGRASRWARRRSPRSISGWLTLTARSSTSSARWR